MTSPTPAPRPYAERVMVVTGGSSGLGRGVALAAARRGFKVVIGDLDEQPRPGGFDEEAGETTEALIRSRGGQALFVRGDIGQASDAQALVAGAVDAFGRVDVLVNNAGVWRGGPFHELPEAALDDCWNVIVKGSWHASQAAIRHFLERDEGGAIINIVSTAGLRGHRGQAAYNVAKAAQANLTRCLALEYGHAGIRVNGVCPTNVKTAMSRGGFEYEPARTGATQAIPLGRWGEIGDVAELAVFLASDEASFINGALIPVDGGETLGAARVA